MSRVWVGMALLAGFTISCAGCGQAKKPWEKVYPAKGVVTFKGKPISGAMITLVSQNSEFPDTVRPTATSTEDGSFTVGTYSTKDGAPAGQYKALVFHYPVIVSKDNAVAGPNDLPKKYSRAETSDLLITINTESTEIPTLELR